MNRENWSESGKMLTQISVTLYMSLLGNLLRKLPARLNPEDSELHDLPISASHTRTRE